MAGIDPAIQLHCELMGFRRVGFFTERFQRVSTA